jgi:hypothetical protein
MCLLGEASSDFVWVTGWRRGGGRRASDSITISCFVEYLKGFFFLFAFHGACESGMYICGCVSKRPLFLKMAILSGR